MTKNTQGINMPRPTLIATALSLLLATLPLAAQSNEESSAKRAEKPLPSVEELEQQSAQAMADENWVRLYVANRKLEQQRPWDPSPKINIVRAAGMLDRRNTAYHYMLLMQRQGMSYDFNQWPETEKIRDTEVYEYLNELMTKAGLPSGNGEVAWKLDQRAAGFSAMAWDERRERFLVGRATDNLLLAVDPSGDSDVLLELPAGQEGIHGLALGADGDTLWVSGSELLKFGLTSKALQERIGPGVEGAKLGAVTAAPDGSIYVIDTANATLLRLQAGSESLQAVPTGELLHKPSALALNANGTQLYVADGVTGLVMVDTLAQLAYPVSASDGLNMGYITGMAWHDGALLVVQSGFSPDRVIRMILDVAGAHIEEVAPMATALPEFDGPAAATVRDDQLVYFANASTSNPAAPLIAMQTSVDEGSNIKPPDMFDFQEAIRTQQQEQAEQAEQP
jgi:DNA-binding beta-propeller fold protein YncE